VPSPDLKCYSIFCFKSRSGVFVFLVLDLCAGPEAVFFSRRRCVSGTGSFTGPIFAWSLSRSCSQSGQRPHVLPPHGRSRSQLVSRSQAQIHFLTDFPHLGLWSILQVVLGAARVHQLALSLVHRRIRFCSRLFLCLCATFSVWFYRRQSVSPPWALHL
jgi:hypothetical protein